MLLYLVFGISKILFHFFWEYHIIALNNSRRNDAVILVFICTSFLQPVQDPKGMTETIVQALERTGQRGIINKGWGGLGNSKWPIFASYKQYYFCL